MHSILNFGKHEGKSLPEVLLHDPDWFFWAIENHVLEKRLGLAAEARDLDFKARNIKIPKPDTEHWRVNYLFDHRDKFWGFSLVPVPQQQKHVRTVWIYRLLTDISGMTN